MKAIISMPGVLEYALVFLAAFAGNAEARAAISRLNFTKNDGLATGVNEARSNPSRNQ